MAAPESVLPGRTVTERMEIDWQKRSMSVWQQKKRTHKNVYIIIAAFSTIDKEIEKT